MTEHPKCKTCRHFKAESGVWDNVPGFGECGLVGMTCKMTDWDDGENALTVKDRFSEHLAGVMDAESYHATLHPHPDFYCPMHSDLMPQLVAVK